MKKSVVRKNIGSPKKYRLSKNYRYFYFGFGFISFKENKVKIKNIETGGDYSEKKLIPKNRIVITLKIPFFCLLFIFKFFGSGIFNCFASCFRTNAENNLKNRYFRIKTEILDRVFLNPSTKKICAQVLKRAHWDSLGLKRIHWAHRGSLKVFGVTWVQLFAEQKWSPQNFWG